MVLDLESRCPPGHNGPKIGGTLRMIHESCENREQSTAQEDRNKYCYPFKEYDPTSTSNTGNRSHNQNHNRATVMSHHSQLQNGGTVRSGGGSGGQSIYSNFLPNLDKTSQLRGSRNELYQKQSQNLPPSEPPPLPPRRSTSLFGGGGSGGGGSTTMTLLRIPKPRESSTLNPKRISIATSSFWTGHPDLAHFASGWELGQNSMRTQSVWGTTDRGGRPVTESVDIWGDPPAVKKGILIQQREKLWSRWKERYFILTRDYLNCFRRTTSVHRSGVRLSEMGSFIYKLRLAEVDGIEWETRKSGTMIAIMLPTEPKILLRVPGENYEALHQWYTLLQECIYMSKERRQALRNQHGSMLRSTTTCYNPNVSKSTGSASPNSSSTKSSSSATSASNNSKSASNSDLDRLGPDGGDVPGTTRANNSNNNNTSLRRKVSNTLSRSGSGLLSLRKISGGSSPSPRSFLRAHAEPSGKYSPLQDEDDDDDEVENDYEEAPLPPHPHPPLLLPPPVTSRPPPRISNNGNINTNRSVGSNTTNISMSSTSTGEKDKGADPDEEFKVTLRQRRGEINNNFGGSGGGVGHPTSWRLSLSQPPEHFDDPYHHHHQNGYGGGGGLNLNVNNINSSMRIRLPQNNVPNMNANNNGYATPHDARARPESWTPQPTVFYRTASLVPAQWMNPRDVRQQLGPSGPNSNIIGGGACSGGGLNVYDSGSRGHFNRASVMYCPSRVTSDVTFRKNVK